MPPSSGVSRPGTDRYFVILRVARRASSIELDFSDHRYSMFSKELEMECSVHIRPSDFDVMHSLSSPPPWVELLPELISKVIFLGPRLRLHSLKLLRLDRPGPLLFLFFAVNKC